MFNKVFVSSLANISQSSMMREQPSTKKNTNEIQRDVDSNCSPLESISSPETSSLTKKSATGRNSTRVWSSAEDKRLLDSVKVLGTNQWDKVSMQVGNNRTKWQCAQRWYRGIDPSLNKGPWTIEEEDRLNLLVEKYGLKAWKKLADEIPHRSDVQCRYHYQTMMKKEQNKNEQIEHVRPKDKNDKSDKIIKNDKREKVEPNYHNDILEQYNIFEQIEQIEQQSQYAQQPNQQQAFQQQTFKQQILQSHSLNQHVPQPPNTQSHALFQQAQPMPQILPQIYSNTTAHPKKILEPEKTERIQPQPTFDIDIYNNDEFSFINTVFFDQVSLSNDINDQHYDAMNLFRDYYDLN